MKEHFPIGVFPVPWAAFGFLPFSPSFPYFLFSSSSLLFSLFSSLTFSNMVWITNPDVGEQRRRLDHDGMSGFSLVFEGP